MADHIKTDTPSTSEAFDVAGSNFDYVLIDSADKYVDWFAQALSTAATGKARIDRTKYSDNDVSTFLSRVFVMISSRTPWFRQDDVASRLLIWHLKRMPATVGVDEQDRYDEVQPRRNELMSAVARVIQRILQGPDYEGLNVKHESRLRNWIRLATWIGESYDPVFRDSLAGGNREHRPTLPAVHVGGFRPARAHLRMAQRIAARAHGRDGDERIPGGDHR